MQARLTTWASVERIIHGVVMEGGGRIFSANIDNRVTKEEEANEKKIVEKLPKMSSQLT